MRAIHERKREIEILQAIGAKQGTVFNIFLLESGLYGLLAGIIGLGLGIAFSWIAVPYISQNEFTAFMKGSRLAVNFELKLIFESSLFYVIISLISGFYPAWEASKTQST